jgi:acetate kinase
MKILVINCGSSSIKYQLFDMEDEVAMVSGLAERIGGLVSPRERSPTTSFPTQKKN